MTRTLTSKPETRPSSGGAADRLRRRFPQLPGWLILVLLAGALVGGILLSPFPGLQYDETLFVNAATTGGPGSDSTQFVAARYAGVPVLLMRYIGALKAWLMAPVFSIFGVSVESVRIPMVVVLVLTVAVVVAIVWRHAGRWPAVVAALVATTDPVFALMSRADWGPVALAGLFRAVALLAVLRLLSTRRTRWLWVLAISLSLGAFNKLDFSLFALSMVAAALIVFGRRWVLVLTTLRWRIAPPAVVAAIVFGWVFINMFIPSTRQPVAGQGIRATLLSRTNLVTLTFDGRYLGEYMAGVRPTIMGLLLPASLIALVVALLFLAIARWLRGRKPAAEADSGEAPADQEHGAPISNGRILVFFALAGLLLFLAMCVTPEVTGPHHAEMLWPYPVLLIAFAFGCVIERRSVLRVLRVGTLSVMSVVVVVAVVSQLGLGIQTAQILADPGDRTVIWSDDPDAAAARLSQLDSPTTPDLVLVADWGIANQVAALVAPSAHLRVADRWGDFVGNASAPDLATALQIAPGAHFYLLEHTAESEIMTGSTEAGAELLSACQARGGAHHRVYSGASVVGYDVTC